MQDEMRRETMDDRDDKMRHKMTRRQEDKKTKQSKEWKTGEKRELVG